MVLRCILIPQFPQTQEALGHQLQIRYVHICVQINYGSSLLQRLEHYYTCNNVLLVESCKLGGIFFQTQQNGGRVAGVLGRSLLFTFELPLLYIAHDGEVQFWHLERQRDLNGSK